MRHIPQRTISAIMRTGIPKEIPYAADRGQTALQSSTEVPMGSVASLWQSSALGTAPEQPPVTRPAPASPESPRPASQLLSTDKKRGPGGALPLGGGGYPIQVPH